MAKLKKAALPERVKAKRLLKTYYEALRKDGWVEIGSGGYALVFAKGGYVIKVAMDSPNYEEYLSYVLANQDNPHVPKIVSVHRYDLKKGDFRPAESSWDEDRGKTAVVVKMEKLKFKGWEGSTRISGRLEKAAGQNPWDESEYQPLNKNEEVLVDILRHVWHRKGSDLGGPNLLFRGDTYVVTDPVYG